MFCRNCGKQIDESFNVCPYCAHPVNVDHLDEAQENNQNDIYISKENAQNIEINNQSTYSYGNQNYSANTNQNNYNASYQQNQQRPQPAPTGDSEENVSLIKVLGFFLGLLTPFIWFLPIGSILLYIIWKSDKPKSASAIFKFTIIGLIVGFSLTILFTIIMVVLLVCFAAGPVFNFSIGLLEELIKFIPFDTVRELIRSIFELLPFDFANEVITDIVSL